MRVYQGIDLVKVSRVQKLVESSTPLALRRIFTPREIAYSQPKRTKYEHYAARFAAKEAVIKILKQFSKKTISMNEIEVRHEKTGKPYIQLGTALKKLLPRGSRLEISLSHEREFAMAAAVLAAPEV